MLYGLCRSDRRVWSSRSADRPHFWTFSPSPNPKPPASEKKVLHVPSHLESAALPTSEQEEFPRIHVRDLVHHACPTPSSRPTHSRSPRKTVHQKSGSLRPCSLHTVLLRPPPEPIRRTSPGLPPGPPEPRPDGPRGSARCTPAARPVAGSSSPSPERPAPRYHHGGRKRQGEGCVSEHPGEGGKGRRGGRTHLCELDVVVIELLLHDLLQDLEREHLGLLQAHRLRAGARTTAGVSPLFRGGVAHMGRMPQGLMEIERRRERGAHLVVRVLQLALRTLASCPDRLGVIPHERAGRVGVEPGRGVGRSSVPLLQRKSEPKAKETHSCGPWWSTPAMSRATPNGRDCQRARARQLIAPD